MKDKNELCECDDLETRVERIEKWMDKYAVFYEDLYEAIADFTHMNDNCGDPIPFSFK